MNSKNREISEPQTITQSCRENKSKEKSGFELTYCNSGNTIHFSFFSMQFFPPSLKIAIPKYNIKKEK